MPQHPIGSQSVLFTLTHTYLQVVFELAQIPFQVGDAGLLCSAALLQVLVRLQQAVTRRRSNEEERNKTLTAGKYIRIIVKQRAAYAALSSASASTICLRSLLMAAKSSSAFRSTSSAEDAVLLEALAAPVRDVADVTP